jgi:hypothetical protein
VRLARSHPIVADRRARAARPVLRLRGRDRDRAAGGVRPQPGRDGRPDPRPAGGAGDPARPAGGDRRCPGTVSDRGGAAPTLVAGERTRRPAGAGAPPPTGPPTRLTVSGSAARAVLALPTPAESPTTPATSPETRPDAAPAPSSESAPEPPPTSSVTVPTSAAPAPATRKPAVNGAPTEPEDLSGTNVAPSAQTTDTETAEPTATTAAEPGPETSTTRARGRHGAGRAAEHPSDQPDAG